MTQDTKKLKFERRKQKALQRLNSTNPHCIICGEADWRCLELHHEGQERFDSLTAIYCRNCHRKASDAQMEHPDSLSITEPMMLECIGHVLLGLADFFELLLEKFRKFGNYLIEIAKHNITSNASIQPVAEEK